MEHEKFVVLKKAQIPDLPDKAIIEKFRNEAENIAKLRHENIVEVIDSFSGSKGEHWIVMEYIEGLDLGSFSRKARENNRVIPPELYVYIVSEVLRALDYVHKKKDNISGSPGMVHGDIAPGNIMLCSAGVKLLDFGLAGEVPGKGNQERNNILKGNLAYMSPELLESGGEAGIQSDIYSAGIVLWELLAGKKLFNVHDNLDAMIDERNRAISYENIPAGLKHIIAGALKVPGKYGSASEMEVELRAYLDKKGFPDGLVSLRNAIIDLGVENTMKYKIPGEKARGGRNGDFKRGIRTAIVFSLFLLLVAGLYDARHGKTVFGAISGIITGNSVIIDTIPSGAEVIIKKEGRMFETDKAKRTPLGIRRLLAGEYELKFGLEGYEPVIKKMVVEGRGAVKIVGSEAEPGEPGERFLLPFKMDLAINSVPAGARIILDREDRGEAPVNCRVTAGEHHVEMKYPGREQKCIVNIPGEGRQVDGRFWQLAYRKTDGMVQAILTGSLNIALSIDSVPGDASVYIDNNPESSGITPVKELYLKPGKHLVKLEKYGFLTWEKNIVIDREEIALNAELKKRIRVYAYDKQQNRDISASVEIQGTGVKSRKTPFSYSLKPGHYTMKFKGAGYGELIKEINVTEDTFRIEAGLVPSAAAPEKDATLIVDARPAYTGAKIFVDDKIVGDTVRRVKNLARGAHTVMIKHPELPEPAVKTVMFDNLCLEIILKLDESGGVYRVNK